LKSLESYIATIDWGEIGLDPSLLEIREKQMDKEGKDYIG